MYMMFDYFQPIPSPPVRYVPPTAGPIKGHKLPVAFISGPLKADIDYFNTHYLSRIQQAISNGHSFIVGSSRGIDAFALDHLRTSGTPLSRVRVYITSTEEKRLRSSKDGLVKWFEDAGGVLVIVEGGHAERDRMMTRTSHYDILRYHTERECWDLYGKRYGKKYEVRVSPTQMNERRRCAGEGLVWRWRQPRPT